MKIGIIGAGAVGAACLTALVSRGCAREIVVVNRNRKRSQGLVADTQYGAVLCPPVDLRDGDYDDLEGCELVMITAGLNEKSGGATDRGDPAGRLRLLEANIDVYRDIVPRIHSAAPQSIVLVVTDPPDPLADAVRKLGHARVLSTGTFLDSLRFRFHLAEKLGVNAASIDALVVGEHGTSEVFVWSAARAAGAPVLDLFARSDKSPTDLRQQIEQEVRYANISIIEGIGASQHGIGVVAARVAEIILRDERAVVPIGSLNPNYGVTLSLPSILGRTGVVEIFEPHMSEDERQALHRSAETLNSAVAQIRI
jgi:L-lactate dehydrogenase